MASVQVTAAPRRRWLIPTVGAITLALAVLAARHLGVSFANVSWAPLSGVLLVSLVSPILSAAEYRLLLNLAGASSRWVPAIRISVYGTLANVLPVPGGMALRIKGMTEQGSSVRRAVGASAATGLIWLTVSGLTLAWAGESLRWALIAISIALGITAVLILNLGEYDAAAAVKLVAVEALFVASAALRFYFALAAIGASVGLFEAVALGSSGPISAALGIVPGALGVFEAMSAGISILVGLPGEAGFLAGALIRVLGVVSLLAWTPVINRQSHRRPE